MGSLIFNVCFISVISYCFLPIGYAVIIGVCVGGITALLDTIVQELHKIYYLLIQIKENNDENE